LYNKAPMRYDEWSRQMFDREQIKDEKEIDAKFDFVLSDRKKRAKAVEALVHSGKFSRDELCAVASIPIMYADDLIGVLLRNRVLRKGDANTWEITPAGKRWLERYAEPQ
jgi:predicted transcriptional regulator